jgi:hypothetical protein
VNRRGATFVGVLVAVFILGILVNLVASARAASRLRAGENARRERAEAAALGGVRAAAALLAADPAVRGNRSRTLGGATVELLITDALIGSRCDGAAVWVQWRRGAAGGVTLGPWRRE